MKPKIFVLTIAIITLFNSIQLIAEETSQTKTDQNIKTLFGIPLTGKLNLSFAKDKGNVNEEALRYGLKIHSKINSNDANLTFKGKKTERSKKSSTETYEVSLLDVYHLNDISAMYGKITSYQNIPKGYTHQWRLGFGYLHTWYQANEKQFFNTRIGYQNRDNDFATGIDDHQDFLLVGFRTQFPIMTNISLFTQFHYGFEFANAEEYEIEVELASIFVVNKQIDLKMEYELEYSHVPVPGRKARDTSFLTSIIYKF